MGQLGSDINYWLVHSQSYWRRVALPLMVGVTIASIYNVIVAGWFGLFAFALMTILVLVGGAIGYIMGIVRGS